MTQTLFFGDSETSRDAGHEVHPLGVPDVLVAAGSPGNDETQPAKGPWSACSDRYREHVMTCDSASLGGGPHPHRPLRQLNAVLSSVLL